MVRPRRVVRGLGATPKRRSAGLVMASRWKRKSEVRGPKSEVRWASGAAGWGSGLGFERAGIGAAVSALCVILTNGSPPGAGMGMDESRISMKESRVGLECAARWTGSGTSRGGYWNHAAQPKHFPGALACLPDTRSARRLGRL